MLKVNLLTLSDYASVSQEGKLTIAGIFDKLNVGTFPTSIIKAFFVATINGDAFTQYNLDLDFTKDKKQIASFALSSTTGENGRNNLVVEMVGLPIETEGEYYFILRHEKKELGRTMLEAVTAQSQKKNEKVVN
jgi:hypothetical protein